MIVGAVFSNSLAMAAEKPINHEAKFTVYFSGIPVGVAVFDLLLKGKQYQLAISGKTIGLTKLLSNGKGSVRSAGIVHGSNVQSDVQRLNYKDSKKKISSLLVFKNKNLVSEKITPKPKVHSDTVPVYEADKIGVIDPASGIILPVTSQNIGNGREICNRTLAIYDGGARYDIRLRYKRKEKRSIKGFKGEVFVCQLRWIPVAGHRPKKNVKYMANNKGIEVSYAQLKNEAIYMPIKFTVPTKYGTVVAKATKFTTQ